MNTIDPTVIIRGDVRMGTGNVIHPHCILQGPLQIGDHNIIGPFVTIGSPAEDTRAPRHDATDRPIVIGSHNVIREYASIQKPRYEPITSVGDHVYLMTGSLIGHDSVIESHVTICPRGTIAGLVRILEGAVVAISASVHQRGVVGPYAIVGQGAPAVKNVRPFSRYIPGKELSVNRYAIEKFGFTELTGEIESFVLKNERPRDASLLALIERYESSHGRSGRHEYR